jgi:hypothetical protein
MRNLYNKPRTSVRDNVLHVHVWSSRLFCFGLLKLLFRFGKYTCVLAIIGGIIWGIQQIIQRAFYDNPEFTLQVVDINPNSAIDEIDFVKVTGINLRANLFRIDIPAITKCLKSLPQVADAQVERRLPGTLVVHVTARNPRAWIACPDAGIPVVRQVGAMLVDDNNIAYPCAARQFASAAKLPIIILPARATETITMGEKIRQPELQRCLQVLAITGESAADSQVWIDSIKQANVWSLALTTSDGATATLGLVDQARQVSNLRAALRHAENKGYAIETINLIPKENVPITVNTGPPPKAIPVVEPPPQVLRQGRHPGDSKTPHKRE